MSDIDWMKLEEGVHYSALIDLGDEFKTFDPKYRGNKWAIKLQKLTSFLKGTFL